MSDSILDKVINSQKSALASELNPRQILMVLFNPLNEREREVINLRYGLDDGIFKTLEEIGKKFNVTRERIRQIENAAIKKIKAQKELDELLKPLEITSYQVLEDYGGIMHEDSFIKNLIIIPGPSNQTFATTHFLIANLLNHKVQFVEPDDHFERSWKLPTISLDDVKEQINNLLEILENFKRPLNLREILEKSTLTDLSESKLLSLLEISQNTSTNPFNEWGLKHWNSISLKRMSDKIYLILKKENQPLHFTKIAERINEIGFDKKKANPATIHNELILDKKYVLVGRGIYALKEWGYEPGVVSDVIEDILKEADQPLSREEIIERVLNKRMVKRSTIILALMDKTKFIKNSNKKYSLPKNSSTPAVEYQS